MKIAISGASGFIGSNLIPFLKMEGHQIFTLTRHPSQSQEDIYWDPEKDALDASLLEGMDAIINLAGESLIGRWTKEKKRKILQSRVKGTALLSEALSKLSHPPKIFINSSAIGIYGNQDDKICPETTPPGQGFLANVCQQWEAATEPAQSHGIRVVLLRTSMVLSPKGGALKKMLLPFKLGLGGKLGNGQQFMSWISLNDLIRIISFALLNNDLQGPINVAAPQSVTNEEFTKDLGTVLHRPTFFSMPDYLLKFAFGEMSEEVFLSSIRAEPARLMKAGYSFLYPDLKGALKHMLEHR